MFSELLKIINLFKNAVDNVVTLKNDNERKNAHIEMLKTYFIFLDVHSDGVKLLEAVDNNPIEFINNLDEASVEIYSNVWDKVLRRQGVRLYHVQKYINSNSYLSVIAPDAVERILEIIGNKSDRVTDLYRVGQSLFFRNMLPIDDKPEDIARVSLLTLTKRDFGLVDKDNVKAELDAFKNSLDEFRSVVVSTINNDDLQRLSSIARKETEIKA